MATMTNTTQGHQGNVDFFQKKIENNSIKSHLCEVVPESVQAPSRTVVIRSTYRTLLKASIRNAFQSYRSRTKVRRLTAAYGDSKYPI